MKHVFYCNKLPNNIVWDSDDFGLINNIPPLPRMLHMHLKGFLLMCFINCILNCKDSFLDLEFTNLNNFITDISHESLLPPYSYCPALCITVLATIYIILINKLHYN